MCSPDSNIIEIKQEVCLSRLLLLNSIVMAEHELNKFITCKNKPKNKKK